MDPFPSSPLYCFIHFAKEIQELGEQTKSSSALWEKILKPQDFFKSFQRIFVAIFWLGKCESLQIEVLVCMGVCDL